ncbi:hypothetical protein HRG84_08170 [Flavisolibacter sp. BT320]|nr:hypothetical protein [Flavisolibacter longurius]
MTVIDKSRIIEAIQQTDDERILFAINRLLQIDEDEIQDWQKLALDNRNQRIDTGAETLHNWDDIKEDIKNLD